MELTVTKDDLKQGIECVSHARKKKSDIVPALNNISVSVDQDHLKLCATDLEIVITCWVNANVNDGNGSTTVDPEQLLKLVKKTKKGQDVSLRVKGESDILCINSSEINGIASDDFPMIATTEDLKNGGHSFKVRGAILKQMVSQTKFAVSVDDFRRPVLLGVSFFIEKGMFKMAATDAFRLSVTKTDVDYNGESVSGIIPKKAVVLASSLVKNDDDLVEIIVKKETNQIMFLIGNNVTLLSQLIEGTYPDFAPIIPKRSQFQTTVVVNRKALLETFQTTHAIVGKTQRKIVKITVVPDDDAIPSALQIEAREDGIGESKIRIKANVQGVSVVTGCDASYMLDLLKAIKTPQVRIKLKDKKSPMMIHPVGDRDFFHIIMPAHVS